MTTRQHATSGLRAALAMVVVGAVWLIAAGVDRPFIYGVGLGALIILIDEWAVIAGGQDS